MDHALIAFLIGVTCLSVGIAFAAILIIFILGLRILPTIFDLFVESKSEMLAFHRSQMAGGERKKLPYPDIDQILGTEEDQQTAPDINLAGVPNEFVFDGSNASIRDLIREKARENG